MVGTLMESVLIAVLHRFLRPFLHRVHYDRRRVPRFLEPLVLYYARGYIATRMLPHLLTVHATGAGMTDAWWPAGTDGQTILGWFDEELAATLRLGPWDYFRMAVVAATEAELDAAEAAGVMDEQRVLVRWGGWRKAWWTEGRDMVAAAIPPDHRGLYTITDGMGTAFVEAFRPRDVKG